MVDIQRLARNLFFFAIGLLLGGASVTAFAEDYSAIRPPWVTAGVSNPAATPEESCEQYSLANGAVAPGVLEAPVTIPGGVVEYRCWYTRSNGQSSGPTTSATRSCPAGGTLDFGAGMCRDAPPCETGERNLDGSCFTCPEGRTWNGTTCVSKCELDAGKSAGTGDTWVTVDLDSTPSGDPSFCMGGCIVKGARTECVGAESATSGGDYVQIGQLCQIQGPFTQTGGACTHGTGSTPNFVGVEQEGRSWWDTGKDDRECVESGGQPGEVNGASVCVRPQAGETWDTKTESSSEPTKTTTQNQDGTSTETTTTTSTSTSGGKATTTTTTTTTTKDANGDTISSETTTETTEQPVDDFCAKNPKDPKCVGKTTGGKITGMQKCDAEFKCSGDAVMCAIAKAERDALCQTSGAEQAGAAFLGGLPGEAPSAEKVSQALNADGAFDFDFESAWEDAQQTYVDFASACLPPLQFELNGQTFTFDTDFICEIGDYIRVMLHLFAYMAVLGIISRAFGG